MEWLENLIDLRAKRGMSYKEISDKTGLPYSAVMNLFNRKNTDPKLLMVNSIVQCMDGDLDMLFGEQDDGMTDEERELMEYYRSLDYSGKELVQSLMSHEFERVEAIRRITPRDDFSIIYYDFPVSAGTGEFMDINTASVVSLSQRPPKNADYLLRIAGNSMEPEFSDGDYVYVEKTDQVEHGEIGIFSYAGSVYIKVYTKDGLMSLNPDYDLIPGDADIKCLGKVVGKARGRIKKQ